MDQIRLLLAIGLSFLVLFIWTTFFTEKPPIQEQAAQPKQEEISKKEDASSDKKALDAEIIENTKKEFSKKAISEIKTAGKIITINTPNYQVKISEEGAVLRYYALNKYNETVDPESNKKELVTAELKNGNILTTFSDKTMVGLNEAMFVSDFSGDTMDVSTDIKKLSFTWVDDNGSILQKTYSFDPNSYLISLDINVKNGSDRIINDNIALSIYKKQTDKKATYGFEGPSGLINGEREEVKTKKIEDKDLYTGKIKWIAIEGRYFISSIIPKEQKDGSMKLVLKDDILENRFISPRTNIEPGTQKTFEYLIFIGPKNMELLNSLDYDLNKALNFGFFDILAKPCLWFMNVIYGVIPNYGIAIIILTLFTKILLWPLGSKSYKSMAEMKKLQPLMTELREKHKGDKQQMNRELMALYKTYKVNPMGGCLPMVLQIPVFFALYRMLYQAIELRHAPFFLWINDLSAPDRLFNFDFSIPFMEPPFGIPVLTIIMGATMLLQQKMSPPPGDPAQAKMMMFMPLIFTFIFINFSAGLVLYWMINNILSIGQQYYIQKKAA